MSKESATAFATEVAAYLKTRHGATRVLLFGSTVDGTFFPEHSDIDLYFEGVAYEREFEVSGETVCAFPSLELDLAPAGHAPDFLRREVEATGVAV